MELRGSIWKTEVGFSTIWKTEVGLNSIWQTEVGFTSIWSQFLVIFFKSTSMEVTGNNLLYCIFSSTCGTWKWNCVPWQWINFMELRDLAITSTELIMEVSLTSMEDKYTFDRWSLDASTKFLRLKESKSLSYMEGGITSMKAFLSSISNSIPYGRRSTFRSIV